MKLRVMGWLAGAVVALAVLVTANVSSTQAASGRGNGGARPGKVEGTITGFVAANGVVIRKQDGQSVTVVPDVGAKIERNGVRATIGQFQVGDRGQALYEPSTGVATKIEAVGP